MKKLVLAATAAAFAMTSGAAFAAPGNTADATGDAEATVIAPIAITHTATKKLNFGSFTGNAGSVSVDTAGAATVTGDVWAVPSSGSAADEFTVTGDPGRAFTLTSSTGNKVKKGTDEMTFSVSLPSGTSLSSGGSYALKVGGTVNVNASQPAGVYTGTYTVTATYN